MKVCRHYLDTASTPMKGGERPHVTVIVDLASLEGRAGRVCETDRYGVIHREMARRLACDAGIARVITDGALQPLDVGRRTRVTSGAQRRALAVRDGGCFAAGCDVPARWCDAHHIVHWADGGPTDLANLVLLCRRHHRLPHEGRALVDRSERSPPVAA